jgi:hypothetical protein
MRSGYQNPPSGDVVRYYTNKAVEIVGEESQFRYDWSIK